MKWLPEILVAFAVLIFGYILFQPSVRTRSAIQPEASERDIAAERYAQKSAAAQQYNLINAVAYSCLDKYQRDQCVLNLIKCGPSCKALIPRAQFPKIEADYWAMIDERRLRGKVRISP